MYEVTVAKLHEMLSQVMAGGAGEMLVVMATENLGPMPIMEILNAPIAVGKGYRGGDYIMPDEEAKTAADDTPQVLVLKAPSMVPIGWLGRELVPNVLD